MKTRIAAWSLGLLGIWALAGCTWRPPFVNTHWPCRECCTRTDKTTPATTPRASDSRVSALNIPKDRYESTPLASAEDTPSMPVVSAEDIEMPLPAPEYHEQPAVQALDDAGPLTHQVVAQAQHVTELPAGLNPFADRSDQGRMPQSTPIADPSADSYQQLTGQLQQWRKTWRLRYADVGANDAFGGIVVLDGLADTSKLREGQHVRVRGPLIAPSTRQSSARLVVQSMDVLD